MPDPDCKQFVSWEQETKGHFASRGCIFLDDIDSVCDESKCEHKGKSCPWFDPAWIEYWRVEREV